MKGPGHMTVADTESGSWRLRDHPARVTHARPVCFPHAGGPASYSLPVSERFPPAVEVIALQHPGRQDRRQEACITEMDVLADEITEQLLCLSDKPTVFFGHSMGATLAFEVAWRLEQKGSHAPRRVIASGRSAPAIIRREKVHKLDDAGIVAEIRLLNGSGSTLLDDEEILRIALPAIRGDYQAIESYSCVPGRMLNFPITLLTRDSDPRTPIRQPYARPFRTKR